MEFDIRSTAIVPGIQCRPNVSLVIDCFQSDINFSYIFGYWPWTHLMEEQLLAYSHMYQTTEHLHSVVVPAYRSIVRYMGIFGSLFILLSTFGNNSNCKQYFFDKYLRMASTADFLYNMLGQAYNYMVQFYLGESGYKLNAAYVMLVLPGIIAYFSTLNEANTLFLIFERYVALCHPLFWNSVSVRTKYRLFLGSFFGSFLFTAVRLTYYGTVQIERVAFNISGAEELYHIVTNPAFTSKAFEVWMNCNDIIIPILFLVAMLYGTLQVCAVIRRRRKIWVQTHSTVSVTRNSGDTHSAGSESNKATYLMLVTAFTFSMSQITWLAFKVSYIVDVHKSPVTLASTTDQIASWFTSYIVHSFSSISCTAFESAYHAMNFYVYMAFNRRFRADFVQKVKRLLCI